MSDAPASGRALSGATAADVRRVLAELGVSQLTAAETLAIDPRTLRRWLARPGYLPHRAVMLINTWIRCVNAGLPYGGGPTAEIDETLRPCMPVGPVNLLPWRAQ